MMLADAEEIEADLIGQHALLDDVAQRLRLCQLLPVCGDGHVAEGIDAQFDRVGHALMVRSRADTARNGHGPAFARVGLQSGSSMQPGGTNTLR